MGDHVALKLYPGQPRGLQGHDKWPGHFSLLFPSLGDESLSLAPAISVRHGEHPTEPSARHFLPYWCFTPSQAQSRNYGVYIREYSKYSLKMSLPLACCNQVGGFFHGLQWPEGLGFSHPCLHLGVITQNISFSNTPEHCWVQLFQPSTMSGSSSRWLSRSSASKQTSNMQIDRALLLFTGLQDFFSKDTGYTLQDWIASRQRWANSKLTSQSLQNTEGVEMKQLGLSWSLAKITWWITWWKSSVPRNLTKFNAINCTNITPFIRGSQTASQILGNTCPTASLIKIRLFLIFVVGNITLWWELHLVNT